MQLSSIDRFSLDCVVYLGGDSWTTPCNFAEDGVLEIGQAWAFWIALVQEQVPESQRACLCLQLFNDWRDDLGADRPKGC